MRISEKVIRYMEGEMAPTEKKEFEAELQNSVQLKNEIELYNSLFQKIKNVKNIPSDARYFASIIPRFRLYQQGAKRRLYPAFAAVTLAVVVFILFLNLPEETTINTVVDNSYSKVETDSIMNDFTEYYGSVDSIISNNEEYSAVIDDMLLDELNISAAVLDSVYYSSYSQVISDLSDEESQIVYDEIINKRFF